MEYGSLVLFSTEEEAVDALPTDETALAVPGRTAVGMWLFEASLAPPAEVERPASSEWEARLDADALRR